MTQQSEPTMTRKEVKAHYEQSNDTPTDCWQNYGDVNPAPHGGDWIHYDNSWSYIGTFCAEEVGFDMSEFDVDDPIKAQWVYACGVHWRDIVTEDGEWTDGMQGTVDSLHNAPETPTEAVVDGRLTWLVVAFADSRGESYRVHDPVRTGDYYEIIKSVGVEPCNQP